MIHPANFDFPLLDDFPGVGNQIVRDKWNFPTFNEPSSPIAVNTNNLKIRNFVSAGFSYSWKFSGQGDGEYLRYAWFQRESFEYNSWDFEK